MHAGEARGSASRILLGGKTGGKPGSQPLQRVSAQAWSFHQLETGKLFQFPRKLASQGFKLLRQQRSDQLGVASDFLHDADEIMRLVVRHRIEALAGRGRAVDDLFDPDVVAGDFGGELKRRLAQTMRRALNMMVERCAAGQDDADRAGAPVAVSVCLSQSAPYALDHLRFDIATLEVNLR